MKLKIGFVGSPFSGKTTTAAHVFSELKRLGLPVEFLPEYAREHIRNRRKEAYIQDCQQAPMSDSDQKSILRGQWTAEKEIMDFSGDSVILVTDGSTINAQFYAHTQILDRERCVQQYDILFFSRNIERPVDSNKDGNRVHDADFSVQVDAAMKNYFDRERHPQVIELSGGVDERVGKALSAIAEMIKMLEGNVQ